MPALVLLVMGFMFIAWVILRSNRGGAKMDKEQWLIASVIAGAGFAIGFLAIPDFALLLRALFAVIVGGGIVACSAIYLYWTSRSGRAIAIPLLVVALIISAFILPPYFPTVVQIPVGLSPIPNGSPVADFSVSGCFASPKSIIGNETLHTVTAQSSCQLTIRPPPDGTNSRYRFADPQNSWPLAPCLGNPCGIQTRSYYYQVANFVSANVTGPVTARIQLGYSSEGVVENANLSASPQQVWSDYGTPVYPRFIRTLSPVNLGDSFTVSAWVNMTGFGGYMAVFANSALGALHNGVRLAINLNREAFFEIGDGHQTSTATCPLPIHTGIWEHLIATFFRVASNITISLSMNGTECQEVSSNVSPNTNQPLAWGCDTSGGVCLNGEVDDIHTLGVALNSSGVRAYEPAYSPVNMHLASSRGNDWIIQVPNFWPDTPRG
jgi:hypothetical protein